MPYPFNNRGVIMKAAIDIGSNSVRLLIGTISQAGVNAICQQLFTTRLGETARGGKLSPSGRKKTILALEEFKKTIHSFGTS